MSKRTMVSAALGVFLLFSLVAALLQSSGGRLAPDDDSAATMPATRAETVGANTSVPTIATPPTMSATTAGAMQRSHLVAYYLHATQRCVTCSTIESYAFEALNTYFSQQIEDGLLELRSIDVQQPENVHYVRDYELEYQSLILALYRGEQRETWRNLAEVWQLVHDKEKFFLYVQSETEALLQEIE